MGRYQAARHGKGDRMTRVWLFPVMWVSVVAGAVEPPAPYGPVPSERQLAWHALEYYGFVHYTVNAFTDKEWGYGDEDPAIFNPTDPDVRQWARVAREAGMKGLILTAKHHDGFCLWPSRYTEHSIKDSPYKNGQGDIVRELSDACREEGILFGVYLSPWDRNHPEYARPAYVEYYQNQLRELLTGYGPLFEVWFDGANGGDGWYGGAREKRTIPADYYQWDKVYGIVRELQPNAVMFGGPDIRWVGNESGFAGDPCWHTFDPDRPAADPLEALQHGHADGPKWLPAEVDVSIRPGWFYHEKEDRAVKSPARLMKIYYESVGRGASLLLNLPPDRRGRIHERDVESLMGFRALREQVFSDNLARRARLAASSTRGNEDRFGVLNLTDERVDTYWATDDDVRKASVTLDFGKAIRFDHVVIQEHIALGQRIRRFSVEAERGGNHWEPVADGTSVGWKRIVKFQPCKSRRLRVSFESDACPVVSEIAVYAGPDAQAKK